MSHTANTNYVEASQPEFYSFLEEGNWEGAKEIIKDLWDRNFLDESFKFSNDLLLAQRKVSEPEMSFAEKKQTLCPTVNCTESSCQFMHD